MERLLTMDKEQFISDMQAQLRQILGRVADAVNDAPTGNVISGSEMAVRDAMAELRQRVFEKAVQMRIDSTESSFPPPKDATGRSKQNKGRPPRTTVSVNGRMEWRRVRYHAPGEGSDSPIDRLVDAMESSVSVGMRELAVGWASPDAVSPAAWRTSIRRRRSGYRRRCCET